MIIGQNDVYMANKETFIPLPIKICQSYHDNDIGIIKDLNLNLNLYIRQKTYCNIALFYKLITISHKLIILIKKLLVFIMSLCYFAVVVLFIPFSKSKYSTELEYCMHYK